MNKLTFNISTRASITLFFSTVLLSTATQSATPVNLNISSQPLELTLGVEPNIMMIADDSGSMEDEFMTPDKDGDYFISNSRGGSTQYWKLFDHCLNYSSSEVLPWNSTATGVWRARNSDYNKVYYNPLNTYEPWAGKPAMAISSAGSSSFSVPQNPSKSSCGNVNILANSSNNLQYYPRYYTWNDINNDNVVDSNEQGSHILIKPSTATYNIGSNSQRTDCGTDNTSCTYVQEINNFANWFTYHRRREFVAKYAFGSVTGGTESVRLGYATINKNNDDNIKIAEMTGNLTTGTKKTLLDKIYKLNPYSGTPLRQSLNKAGKYFECKAGSFFSSSNSSPGNSNCPVLPSSQGGECQQNFTLLVTDGFYNGSSALSNDKDSDGNTAFDKGAYSDKSDGSGRSQTLADIAMHYYERDLQTTLNNKVPAVSRDLNGLVDSSMLNTDLLVDGSLTYMHQHMKTFTIGFGVDGTLSAMPADVTNQAFSWPNPTTNDVNKIDDLRHAAFNGRGDFYSASDPNSLTKALTDIFEEIASASGTASAVAFNTQEIQAETKVYRAFFNTKTNTGDLVAQTVNSDGSIDPSLVWSAANKLDSKATDASDRELLSYNATTGSGIAFRHANLTTTLTEDEINYLRGSRALEVPTGSFRARQQTKGRLGDIIHSTPLFIGAPSFNKRDFDPYPVTTGELYSEFAAVSSIANRKPLVYVSANDGILHAFNATTGVEEFGYVPSNIIEGMKDLTDPNYDHKYYVDLTPVANDVYIRPTGTGSSHDWKTVLVGGQGAGGKSYFALDVTGANLTESTGASKVLWEFSHAADLGYTYSAPSIVMTNTENNGNKRWAAVFGNGYNSQSGGAKLFIVFIDGGIDGTWTLSDDYLIIDTAAGPTSSLPMNGLGIPRVIDSDGNGTADYAYAGDLHGNMHRFDLTSSNTGSWGTKNIFTARYLTTSASPQPITTKPIVARNPNFPDDFIVSFSTGSWFTTADGTSTDIQSIYGIWDTMANNTSIAKSDLVEQVITNVVDNTFGNIRTLTDNTVTYTNGNGSDKGWFIDLDVPVAGSSSGVEFPGERAIRNLQSRGNYLFINTVIPQNSSSCVPGTGGFEMAMNPLTGGSGSDPIFDFNGDGSFDASDNLSNNNVVVGRRFDGAIPSDSTFIGNKRYTQLSDKSIVSIDTNTGAGLTTGRISWKEL